VRVAWLLLLATACQQASKTDASTVASAVRAPSASAVAPASAPAKAWFEGAWQGVYQAELFRVEVPVGGVKEWKLDDGKQASGAGKLSLEAAADGSVTGSASGALGELEISGRVDGDRAALMLASGEPNGFHGVILASQAPEGMKGTLTASSADSLQVRRASVLLSRAAK
jgi:hypothetical protein